MRLDQPIETLYYLPCLGVLVKSHTT